MSYELRARCASSALRDLVVRPSLSSQVVLLKDKKKVFTLDGLDYEPEVGALHPGGAVAAVGGAVSGSLL